MSDQKPLKDINQLNSNEALCYLEDMACGRKMDYEPHDLKRIIVIRFAELEREVSKLAKEKDGLINALIKFGND